MCLTCWAVVHAFCAQLLFGVEASDGCVQVLLWLTAGDHAAEGVPVVE